MLPGASAALQAVLDAQLAILLTDPLTLAQTAVLGLPAQVQAAAVAIALLFSTYLDGGAGYPRRLWRIAPRTAI